MAPVVALREREREAAESPPKVTGVVRTREDLRDSAEAQFVAEGYDRAWSSEAASLLRSKLTSHLSKALNLVSLECRESLCRLETSHRDLKEFQEFQRGSLTAHDFGWDGPILYAPLKTQNSGDVIAVTYLTRPGRTPEYMRDESE